MEDPQKISRSVSGLCGAVGSTPGKSLELMVYMRGLMKYFLYLCEGRGKYLFFPSLVYLKYFSLAPLVSGIYVTVTGLLSGKMTVDGVG